MHVVADTLKAKLPDGEWQSYGQGQFFVVPANVKFEVEAVGEVAYLCYYKRYLGWEHSHPKTSASPIFP